MLRKIRLNDGTLGLLPKLTRPRTKPSRRQLEAIIIFLLPMFLASSRFAGAPQAEALSVGKSCC